MARINVKIAPAANAGEGGCIYYQIVHGGSVARFVTTYALRSDEWDRRRRQPVVPPGNLPAARCDYLAMVGESIRRDRERIDRIVRRLEASGRIFTATDVAEEFRRYLTDGSLFRFMECLIGRFRTDGRLRTSETYATTLSSFRKFRGGRDIMLDALTPAVMEAYQGWLRSRGLVANTISFYARILRAVYNRAIEAGIIEASSTISPFKHIYTGVDRTVKRAIPIDDLRRLRALDLSDSPELDYARDIFMLSFLLRGMSFIDMAYLRKEDLCNGRVVYRRRKTGRLLSVGWTGEMQSIIDKYPENASGYLLPILRRPGLREFYACRNISYRINRNLKRVASLAGIATRLTLYVARHSWATAARTKGVPVSVISEGMGHESELTTRIYLAGIDTAVVDSANALVIASL